MMHDNNWNNSIFYGNSMMAMWIWPIALVALVAVVFYFVSKDKSGTDKK